MRETTRARTLAERERPGLERQLTRRGAVFQGQETECITFILVVAASTLMTVCYLQDSLEALEEVHRRMDSDVQPLQLHPAAQQFEPHHTYPFPLGGEAGAAGFLCTQGINGSLTHFFAGSHHAVDFRCPVGACTAAARDL